MRAADNFVFLHGGNHGGWCWARLMESLQQRFTGRMLALDIPGCGSKRGQQREAISLPMVADELIDDIRQAGIDQAVLVGHSMAGVVMPYLAQRAPDLFSQLLFVTTCVPRLGESIMQTMGASTRGVDATVVGYPLDPASTEPMDLMRAMFAPGLSEQDVEWLLRECSQDHWPMPLALEPLVVDMNDLPVARAYIVTEQDPILPPEWQGRFAERSGARAQYSIAAAHEVFLSHPAELAALIERAVSEK
ncbi:MAG: alpha/beta hydrolase [Gammaproteobacteria bacterium]|uniref:alpha/beta fold hydrolase n=1 Tax=Pseudomaricurvus alcaniphilus TaxID=1166482 RepID=UPI00140976F8|nr:alpha/beta hydrolase [Pseudomaricurvus alcaniphilus]MBR9909318.1 alpha/beta hydrolase [Gammaproteobacteria bacterium]NHN38254.1 alpha/beta hydrolase [Pseudomaricurvus alcaniphilus]